MRQKQSISLEKLLKQEWQKIHDCFYLVYGEREDIVRDEHQEFVYFLLKHAQREKFEKYARIWLYRLLVEFITSRYHKVKRQFETESFDSSLSSLRLDERLILILRDRLQFCCDDCAAILQITPWAVERRTFHGREQLARGMEIWSEDTHPFLTNPKLSSLHVRVVLNRYIDKDLPEEYRQLEPAVRYQQGIRSLREKIQAIPTCASATPLPDLKNKRIPLWKKGAQDMQFSWANTPWHYKLIIEGVGFALGGAFAVFILPVILGFYNQNIITKPPVIKQAAIEAEKNIEAAKFEFQATQQDDPFSEVEFPSGHEYHRGAAPLAPSRRKGNIYRLIVQSANPKDLIPQVQELFATAEVNENKQSGKMMPGGVYFDGITTEAKYANMEAAIKAMGRTRTFANRPRGRRVSSDAQARVIIWIQQI